MRKEEHFLIKFTKGMPQDLQIKKEQKDYILAAMREYAKETLLLHRLAERKKRRTMVFVFFGYFKKMNWQELVLALRARSLRINKRIAQRLANENNRKYYLIRSSEIGYRRFSSQDVKFNKSIRVFGKNVNVIKLHETADAVIYPKK